MRFMAFATPLMCCILAIGCVCDNYRGDCFVEEVASSEAAVAYLNGCERVDTI